jgi:hypothetical protein
LPVHAEQLRDATPPSLVDYMPLKGLTHYLYGQPHGFEIVVDAIQQWRERWNLAA